jgi:hypothetical protein
MVEPPPEHKVGDVKTDPSAVVPGHSTMGAKLHLASLPKDAEGNTIHKGARRVNAADLVAKRKAMMAGQKNEEVEELDERELTSGETAEKERIVHGMKKSLKGFKARYGDRAKEVMYATATKQAKKD